MKIYYLSFCDPDKPRGKKFISACLLEMDDDATPKQVIQETWLFGCNPGGDVVIFDITDQWASFAPDHPARTLKFQTRISLEQLQAIGPVHFHH